ncbi:hypothetical protein LMH87_001142 [Akanthomyces muscarius]|uniref:Uncharacterized protein n=1 Tax=Akanthomyces muscarius TaxID=2231603 RepID=A0A9W8QGG6_AKAMU|nr:hypothetical protein LMH87_001142 [Akanthomyces muscarius]KAJ4155920.1 hypothetical protein LMH87_001142 [Akanthomyces muscarius]
MGRLIKLPGKGVYADAMLAISHDASNHTRHGIDNVKATLGGQVTERSVHGRPQGYACHWTGSNPKIPCGNDPVISYNINL